jgi:hypothetical protein
MYVVGEATKLSIINRKLQLPVLQCTPHVPGDTIYWLQANKANLTKYSTITGMDWNIFHKQLGHPSDEVLSQTYKHTKGIQPIKKYEEKCIPCHRCAEGKMPSKSYPPSETRAQKPFDKVHSDIKSFPVASYHKYKYFISFVDDYSSYSWVTLLHTKGAAINALTQFLVLVKNQHNTTVKQWMSDAGGEYKSDVFMKTLKDNGIKVLQSVPYTPQQNGHAECFMHTCMDKAQAMHLDACFPQSWWEFSVEQAVHVYNRTSVRCLKWCTPYELLYKEKPDIHHLRIFGCAAYVYIPEKQHQNKLSPKAELMVYLGHTEGIKGYRFICLKNNVIYYSTTALFHEEEFPKCTTQKKHGTIQVDKPISQQPDIEPEDLHPDGGIFDDDDYFNKPTSHQPPSFNKDNESSIKFPKKEQTPPPDKRKESVPLHPPRSPQRLCQPIAELEPEEPLPAPIPMTPTPSQRARKHAEKHPTIPSGVEEHTASPQPLRRSKRQQKTTTCPGNVYGEDRPPTQIEQDIRWESQWQKLLEELGSSQSPQREYSPMPGEFSPQTQCDEPSHRPTSEEEEDVVEDILYSLAREGGVKLVNHLLAKAVPLDDDTPPLDISKVREWSFKDIMHMPEV